MNHNIIIGYSGHSYVVLDVLSASGVNCYGYCDLQKKENNPFSLEYLGKDQDEEVAKKLTNFNAYLGIGDNNIRAKGFFFLKKYYLNFPVAIHPRSIVSQFTNIEEGVVVMAGAIINPFATIGAGTICNTGSIIEHECKVGRFVHLAPGSVLAGNVEIGEYSFIGANSVIRQGIKIGKNVLVGAGSVIVKDIQDNSVVYGNPSNRKT